MKFVYFVHAIASCWNNGNAHFLRGVGRELGELGHEVLFCEPENAWSETNLLADHGATALHEFEAAFPFLRRRKYRLDDSDLRQLTDGADVVVVHEWNAPELVNALGRMRRTGARFTLLFHDTHHRAVSQPDAMARFGLADYDGLLAFGEVLSEVYRRRGWGKRVWTWHEAADTYLFRPLASEPVGDLVWIGNWGDDERNEEIREFLLEPSRDLRLRTEVYGVRYPQHAAAELAAHGVVYRGWLPNHEAPEVFARARATVHVPRRPYVRVLPGIPTIRVFEALACGIPLVSAPWDDVEQLFPPGSYFTVTTGAAMRSRLKALLADRAMAQEVREQGLRVINERHSCRHRAGELVNIVTSLRQTDIGVTEAA